MTESNSSPHVADKASWRNLKSFTPGKSVVLSMPLNLSLTEEEVKVAVRGFVPRAMEDKWFIYFDPDDDTFNFHRSWTGILIYKVKAKRSTADGGMLLTQVEMNCDPQEYNKSDNSDEEEFEMLTGLIGYLLKPSPNFVYKEWLAAARKMPATK